MAIGTAAVLQSTPDMGAPRRAGAAHAPIDYSALPARNAFICLNRTAPGAAEVVAPASLSSIFYPLGSAEPPRGVAHRHAAVLAFADGCPPAYEPIEEEPAMHPRAAASPHQPPRVP